MKEKTWCIVAFVFAAPAAAFWTYAARWAFALMHNSPSESWGSLTRHLFWVSVLYSLTALLSVVAIIARVRWVLHDYENRNIPVRARRSTLVCTGVVAAATLLFPVVTGYGTDLYQLIVLGSWSLVAHATPGQFADLHHAPIWALAFVLNVGLFLIPAGILAAISARRWPRIFVTLLVAWTMLYTASLFVLFPATNGP